jgi:rubrerythrin
MTTSGRLDRIYCPNKFEIDLHVKVRRIAWMTFGSLNEILDFAIGKEEEAARFYTELAGKMDQPGTKKMFEKFAAEEMGHKKKLQEAKAGKKLLSSEKRIMDLKIGETLEDVEPASDMSYQEALIVAMKAEKAAYRLYTQLADAADDAGMKEMLLSLANEEAKHKLRFEVEYDDMVYSEN